MGGRIAVLALLQKDDEVAKDMAMHVAANNPNI
jgi:translation elongation factor EF-Ts